MSHETIRHTTRRPWFWICAAVCAAAAGLWWIITHHHTPSHAATHHGGPPQSVLTGPVDRGPIRVFLDGLGTVTPLTTVTVHTQINGVLTQVGFQEGQIVQKGDFLAQIDPRPYQVALEQAEGALIRDQALLKQALLDQARYHTLLRQDSIARQQVETQDALVRQDQGIVKTDQGAMDSANLNLVYCHIIAPVTGRVGLRQVDPGNYVQTTDANGLVVLTQIQPISVIFTLPEDTLPLINRQPGGQDGKPAPLPVETWDRANTALLAKGVLETTDNEVDSTTGTVRLRAVFDNAANRLFPGQFVNARLLAENHPNALRVPGDAIQTGAPGSFVYLVKPNHTVTVRVVKLGAQDGDKMEVRAGLNAGDEVVTDGVDRLREGARVVIPDQKHAGA